MSIFKYRILHLPTGLYVSNGLISISYKEKIPLASLTKKGRLWNRFVDVVIAWQVIRKGLRVQNKEELLVDYSVEEYELTPSKVFTIEELEENATKRAIAYKERILRQEINTLTWRIKRIEEESTSAKQELPKLYEQLSKLTETI